MSIRAWITACLAIASVGVASGCGSAENLAEPRSDAAAGPAANVAANPHGNYTLAQARRFDEFALYYAGDEFAGLPLTAVLRRNDRPVAAEPITANSVSFIYGDCTPGPDAGCAPPLEVQIWPACERSLADYEVYPGKPVSPTRLTIRGVPAARFADRLELYTGDVTVIVAANRERDVRPAADVLVPVNAAATGGPTLPPPVPGALEGTLECDGGARSF